ncbi:hypothetical protein BDV19DRAFT_357728 [Aspergillus venezuelensis]
MPRHLFQTTYQNHQFHKPILLRKSSRVTLLLTSGLGSHVKGIYMSRSHIIEVA